MNDRIKTTPERASGASRQLDATGSDSPLATRTVGPPAASDLATSKEGPRPSLEPRKSIRRDSSLPATDPTVVRGKHLHEPQPNSQVTELQLGHDFSRLPVLGNSAGPGHTLPNPVRTEAEHRLNRPLDDVRLHDDAAGGWTALALGARAVTSGKHIYVAPGQLGVQGTSLLMHEVAHAATQQAALGTHTSPAPATHPAEEFARGFAAGQTKAPPAVPVGVYRDPMVRADFEFQIRRFGVGQILDGTFEQQVERLNHFNSVSRIGDKLTRDSWKPWNPGADSTMYDYIMSAFIALADKFGGVPPVKNISFYETDYEVNSAGDLVPDRSVLAEYGGGLMAIYRSALSKATYIYRPTDRSAGKPAQTTPLTEGEGVKETVSHELGHGLVETALTSRNGGAAPDPAFFKDYEREVGWTGGDNPELFDAGVQAVRTALASGTPPPAEYRITEENWNDPKWIEQPVSSYMTGHPSEDLPEAIALYVHTPELLNKRSPRRFAFIESRKGALKQFLTPDLSKVSLQPKKEDLERIAGGAQPSWNQPVPPPPPPTKEPRVKLKEGPELEIRF